MAEIILEEIENGIIDPEDEVKFLSSSSSMESLMGLKCYYSKQEMERKDFPLIRAKMMEKKVLDAVNKSVYNLEPMTHKVKYLQF